MNKRRKDGEARILPNGDMNAVAISDMYGISSKKVFRDAVKSYLQNHWLKDDVKYEIGRSAFFRIRWIEKMYGEKHLKPQEFDFGGSAKYRSESAPEDLNKSKELTTLLDRDSWIVQRQHDIVRHVRSINKHPVIDDLLDELDDLIGML